MSRRPEIVQALDSTTSIKAHPAFGRVSLTIYTMTGAEPVDIVLHMETALRVLPYIDGGIDAMIEIQDQFRLAPKVNRFVRAWRELVS